LRENVALAAGPLFTRNSDFSRSLFRHCGLRAANPIARQIFKAGETLIRAIHGVAPDFTGCGKTLVVEGYGL
jgi:hypothetical protein